MTILVPFLRHLNTDTLAFFMLVALAVLSSIHGKNSETRESAPARVTTNEAVIKAGQRTILDLDPREKGTNADSARLTAGESAQSFY